MAEEKEKKHLVIHGHFYQPPRENPWTERIDRQYSAAPYHDWNERIASECYIPNTCSRRLDGYGRIMSILNNYEWISFNFGPTLLSWLEEEHPDTYGKILEADGASAARLGGHGNAIAQAYNHMIMPLANMRDQETQILWGVHDFERRFKREPEGIWLPETAVDETTLELLISFGFRFVVLSPHQAERIRPIGSGSRWKGVQDGSIPAGFPYRCFGRRRRGKRDTTRCIDIFFYDAPLSQDISFNHLLRNGDTLAESIDAAFPRCGNDLVVIATDGEIYGHHEPFADMALSYLIESAAYAHGLEMTNFGDYLDAHEPQWEVQLKTGPNGEGTAWSCSHGVGRWKGDCGCNLGAPAGWNQAWRAPLRNGLDNLRDSLGEVFASGASGLLADPWGARNDYIHLIEKRNPQETERFISSHAVHPLSPEEKSIALSLLESQRHALLMFTSCGWFFNDLSGIESTQLLKYAARAIELAGERQKEKLEKILLDELERALSNTPGRATGADIYRDTLKNSHVDVPFLMGQHAIFSYLFGDEAASEIFGYSFRTKDRFMRTINGKNFILSRVEANSPYTLGEYSYMHLLLTGENSGFTVLAKSLGSEDEYVKLEESILEIPEHENEKAALKTAFDNFGGRSFVLKDFFPEDREKVLVRLARKNIETVEECFRDLYEKNRNFLCLLKESSLPIPAGFLVPAQTVLTGMLVKEVESWEESPDPGGLAGIKSVIAEAELHGVPIDKTPAAEAFTDFILERTRLFRNGLDEEAARSLLDFTELSFGLGIEIKAHEIQNEIFGILETVVSPAIERLAAAAPAGDTADSGRAIPRIEKEVPAGEPSTGTTPSGTTPTGATSAGAIPTGAAPAGATPTGATPDGAAPNGATPTGATPNGAAPAGATPTGATPDGAAPAGATPTGATPDREKIAPAVSSFLKLARRFNFNTDPWQERLSKIDTTVV